MKKDSKIKHTNLRIDDGMFQKISEIQMQEIKKNNKVINLSDIIRKLLNLGVESYESE